MEDASRHLTRVFGEARAVDITPDRVTAYVASRQRAQAANATINRELAALKRMFRIAEKAGKVDRRPHIAMLAEDNICTGFFTVCLQAGFAMLVSERPRVIKALRIPHDFRRTAVRNLERANVPRSVAMKLVGHRTEAIYRRYAIADASMLREAAAKLSALRTAQREALKNVYFEGPLASFDKVLTKSAASDEGMLKLRGPQLLGTLRRKMVGSDGIEPPTPGFSDPPRDEADGSLSC